MYERKREEETEKLRTWCLGTNSGDRIRALSQQAVGNSVCKSELGEKIHYLVGLQANNGGIGLDCYIDLRLEVDTGSRHSEGPKQPAQTTGQSMENFIKQDLPRGIILRAMKREISQGSPKWFYRVQK